MKTKKKNRTVDGLYNVAYLLLGIALLVHFVPFEAMGWSTVGKYLHGIALGMSCVIIVAIGIRALLAFLGGIRADERALKTVATLRFLLMLALCTLLWMVANRFYADVAMFPLDF